MVLLIITGNTQDRSGDVQVQATDIAYTRTQPRLPSTIITSTAVKPAAVQKNTVKPAAIEIDVRVYYNDYGNHRNNTKGTRF